MQPNEKKSSELELEALAAAVEAEMARVEQLTEAELIAVTGGTIVCDNDYA